MIFKAIQFAAAAHSGQYRKGSKIPYIVHPLNVGRILIENNCDEELVIAGILHDTIEDTSVTIDDIRREFNGDIAIIVSCCSEPDKSDSWENRKKHTIQNLQTAIEGVLTIACADKIDNLRSIYSDLNLYGESVWDRFNADKEKQKWYYTSLINSFYRLINIHENLYSSYLREVDNVFGTNYCTSRQIIKFMERRMKNYRQGINIDIPEHIKDYYDEGYEAFIRGEKDISEIPDSHLTPGERLRALEILKIYFKDIEDYDLNNPYMLTSDKIRSLLSEHGLILQDAIGMENKNTENL